MNEKLKAIIDKVKSGELTPADGLKQIFELLDGEKASKADLQAVKDAHAQIDALQKDMKDVVGKIDELRISGGGPRNDDEKKWGWKSLGEFAAAVARASKPGANPGSVDQRLLKGKEAAEKMAKAATDPGLTSSVDDVGVIPPDFSRELWQGALDQSNLLSRVDRRDVTGNTIVETKNNRPSEWSATGIQAYWEGEAQQIQESKPELETSATRLYALKALIPMSEEALQDAPYLASEIFSEGRDAIAWKADDAILQGTGVGMPLGIFKHTNALVVVAKEGSQTAATVVAANVAKMWARMPGRYKSDAVWVCNDDVQPQLELMTVGDTPVYMGPNGLRDDAPNGTLKGRPLLPGQHCETLGAQNDIALISPRHYKALTKAGGIQTATSMHLWFDYAVMAFRLIFRMGGYPKLVRSIDPKRGSNKLSAYVSLAVRS